MYLDAKMAEEMSKKKTNPGRPVDAVRDVKIVQRLMVEEFEDVTRPVVEWLRNNWDPHTRAVIDCDGAVLVRDEIGVPYYPKD